jgi:hypothetical protein
VIHSDLQRLDYCMGDMHTPTLKIKEDVEFQRGIVIKLKSEISCLKTELIISFWTLEINSC